MIGIDMQSMLMERQRNFAALHGCELLSKLRSVTINGQTVTPTLLYLGKDYDSSTGWAAEIGETLGLVSTGDAPTKAKDTGLRYPVDYSVDFPGNGKVVQASGSSFADITTEDFYIEGFFKTPASIVTEYFLSKYDGTSGYDLNINVIAGQLSLRIDDGPSAMFCAHDLALIPNTRYFFSIFCDSSETEGANGIKMFINNSIGTESGIAPSALGTLTNSGKLTLGARATLANKFNGNIAYLLMVKRSNLFAGGAQNLTDWAAFHDSRYVLIAPNGL